MATVSNLNFAGFATPPPDGYMPSLSTIAPVESTVGPPPAPAPPYYNAANLVPSATQATVQYDTVYVDTIKYISQTQVKGPFGASLPGAIPNPTGSAQFGDSNTNYTFGCGDTYISNPLFSATTVLSLTAATDTDPFQHFIRTPAADYYYQPNPIELPAAGAEFALPDSGNAPIPLAVGQIGTQAIARVPINGFVPEAQTIFANCLQQVSYDATKGWLCCGPARTRFKWTMLSR